MLGWLVVLALVVVADGVSDTISLGTNNSETSASSRDGRADDGCWIFTHMKKAGGSTIRSMLMTIIDALPPLSGHAVFDDHQWKVGQKYSEEYRRRNNTVMWGGHTEGLRRFEAPRICKWFTTFRQ